VTPTGSTPGLENVAAAVRDDWAEAGLGGAFLARHLDTGDELGLDVDRPVAAASVVKLPIALVVLDLIATGALDAATPVDLVPGEVAPGPTGLARFRHPCRVALEDLLLQMLVVSDNAAADAVLALVPPAQVSAVLAGWGCPDVVVRHPMRALYDAVDAVAGDPEIGMALAVRGSTDDGGHPIAMLDTASANGVTARGLVGLLGRIWTDQVATPPVTARLRDLLGEQTLRHRLGAEIASDTVTISSKTGTFLNLRHEAGVVTTADGDRIAVAALTESRVVSRVQPEADAAIGRAARAALEALRR
jgi:beta-lactamase class A